MPRLKSLNDEEAEFDYDYLFAAYLRHLNECSKGTSVLHFFFWLKMTADTN